MKRISFSMLTVCLCLAFVSYSDAVTLRPPWVPQTQFAGYYLAVSKGFYKNAGIDIQIKDGGPNIMGLREVNAGETDFAIAWLLQAMRLKGQGDKFVHIGQFFQKNSLLLLTKKSSGIDSVEKFSGRIMGVWPGDFQIPPKALLRKYGVTDVRIVEQQFTMDGFLKGEIDIASAMRYNEYYQVLEAGIKPEDLTIFSYSELGMNLPEDGVYVHEDFFKKNPDSCKQFIEASIKGWKYAFANKEEAVELMTRLANETPFKTTLNKQRIMLDEVEKVIDLNSVLLKKEDFKTAHDILTEAKLIKSDFDYESFTGIK